MAEITPALTAEEWARRLVVVPFDGKHGPVDDAVAVRKGGLLQAVSPGVTLDPRIAGAALALPADHPLKITREDVALVAGVAALSKHGEVADALSRLAAKLEALLPPEVG